MTAKTPSGRLLFIDDRDRRLYLQLLAREVRDREWSVLTFCLMTNHVHVLVRTPEPDLGAGIKRMHETFARDLNRRHLLDGHVFGARFHNRLVVHDRHAIGCLRYVARNPVEARMCERPGDWPWSAHGALAGLVEPPDFLDAAPAYELLGSCEDEARAEYLQLVDHSNARLLSTLARPGYDGWMLRAIDDFSVPIVEIAAFVGVTVSTVYRRVAKARATQGSGPSFARAAGGPGPWLAEG